MSIYKGSHTRISRELSSGCLSQSDKMPVSFSVSRSWRRAFRSSLKARSHRSCSSSHRVRPLQLKASHFQRHYAWHVADSQCNEFSLSSVGGYEVLRWACLYVCTYVVWLYVYFVCLSVRLRISKTTCPNFTKFSVYMLPAVMARSFCDKNALGTCEWRHICP